MAAAAGVNLAAVKYHLHSKEALFQAVAQRCMEPVADERLRRLEALPASGGEVTLEAEVCENIIHAIFLLPLAEVSLEFSHTTG